MDFKKLELYDQLSDACAKFYTLFEHLAVEEVIVLSRGIVIFKHCITEKQKCFGITIYKLYSMIGYNYSMRIYLGKNNQCQLHMR
jgi:hypothetical protein